MSTKIAFISARHAPFDIDGDIEVGAPLSHLAALGCRIDVFTCRRDPQDNVVTEPYAGVRVINVPVSSCDCESQTVLNEFADFVVDFVGNERRPYDLVHAQGSASGWIGMQLQQTLNLPLVAAIPSVAKTQRVLGDSAQVRRQERIAIQKSLVARADVLVAQDLQSADDLVTVCGAERDRVVQMPYGIDADAFGPDVRAAARDALHWPVRDFMALHMVGGSLVGVEDMVRAIAALRRTFHIDARLCLAMPVSRFVSVVNGQEVDRLLALAAELQVEDQVFVQPWQTQRELQILFSAADVYVAGPSGRAGAGTLRAMSCGVPVLAMSAEHAGSMVVEGETGYSVAPDHPDALAERLFVLAQDPLHRFALGTAARLRARERFAAADVARRLMGLYARVAAAPVRRERASQPSASAINVAV
ncbi:glycosyltransferase [Uliginosibacterium sp. sgz301328]|uniref:glycosyltransferase n=1 Tax=Uliginosibacterium sp. sgz301328 TaxID=3243764 RepID=UPI00359D2E7E